MGQSICDEKSISIVANFNYSSFPLRFQIFTIGLACVYEYLFICDMYEMVGLENAKMWGALRIPRGTMTLLDCWTPIIYVE